MSVTSAIIAPGPIYTFLSYCNASALAKEVLDCGAGGARPPLAAFGEQGYVAHGIDTSARRLALAARFADDHGIDLDLTLGDMRALPFDDSTLSFVYSYGSICHMTKGDVARVMGEIERVLKPEGLCYVSFLSTEDQKHGKGRQLGPGEYVDRGEEGEYLHCFYEEGEPDRYFERFELLRRERRRVERLGGGTGSVWGELDYIALKP
jgi:SAM-dependent methyltransferase